MNIGSVGENIARNYLVSKNFEIICTNYHSRYGEIDVVCENNEYIVFVEVKSKLYSSNSQLEGRVDKLKKKKIIKTILDYISKNEVDKQLRIDVLEILIFNNFSKINHIENAFEVGDYEFF